jgi:hypothetical protein
MALNGGPPWRGPESVPRIFAAQGQTSFVLPRAKFTTWHPGLTGLQTPLMLHVICCPDVIVCPDACGLD